MSVSSRAPMMRIRWPVLASATSASPILARSGICSAGRADRLEPAPQPLEPGEGIHGILEPHADSARRRDRRKGIGRIVAPGYHQPHVVPLAFGLECERDAVGLELQILAHEIRAGAVE